MAIKLGSTDINSVNLGSVGLNRIYSGSDIVFGGVAPYEFGNYIISDGVNDQGNMASAFSQSSASNFVVSFWIKQPTGGNTTNMVLGYSGDANNHIYLRYGATPNVRYAHQYSSPARQANWNSITWNNNLWHHFYFYSNPLTGINLVFDGVDQGNGGNTAFEGIQFDTFFVRPVSTPFYAEVGMDDFIMTNENGSVSQAQALYNSGAGADPLSILSSPPDVWYKFNIADGETVVPNSGVGSNDLTLSNFTSPYIFPHT